MGYLLLLLTVLSAHGYIHKTVTLWDVNTQNESRRITLFGDYHSDHEANARQYDKIVDILNERAEQRDKKPLCILLEQVSSIEALAFNTKLLNQLSKLQFEDKSIAPRISLENIEIRAAANAAMSVLLSQDDLSNLKGFKLDDHDSVYSPSEITFTDLFLSFKKRKKEIKQKTRQLALESVTMPYFQNAKHYLQLLEQDLRKLDIDHSDKVIEVSERLPQQDNSWHERLSAYILHAFSILFDMHAVCRTREIDHAHDILLVVGYAHMPRISQLLEQSGAWPIDDPHDARSLNGVVAGEPNPLKSDQLDILNLEPSYMKSMHIRLSHYRQAITRYVAACY